MSKELVQYHQFTYFNVSCSLIQYTVLHQHIRFPFYRWISFMPCSPQELPSDSGQNSEASRQIYQHALQAICIFLIPSWDLFWMNSFTFSLYFTFFLAFFLPLHILKPVLGCRMKLECISNSLQKKEVRGISRTFFTVTDFKSHWQWEDQLFFNLLFIHNVFITNTSST